MGRTWCSPSILMMSALVTTTLFSFSMAADVETDQSEMDKLSTSRGDDVESTKGDDFSLDNNLPRKGKTPGGHRCGRGYGNCPKDFTCSKKEYCSFTCVQNDSSMRSSGSPTDDLDDEFSRAASLQEHGGGKCSPKKDKCGRGHTCKKVCTKSSHCVPSMAAAEEGKYNEGDKEIILDYHNKFRNQVAGNGYDVHKGSIGSAKNMQRLYWDKGLAKAARVEVNRHEEDHTFPTTGEDAINCNYGQNLLWTEQLDCNSDVSTIYKAALNAWTAESKYFPPKALNPFEADNGGKKTYGHFAQVVWATTQRVGCSHAQIQKTGDSGDYCRILVRCNYFPAGLVEGHWSMYEQGDAASSCGKIATDYPNLCDDALVTTPQTSTTADGTTWTQSTRNCNGGWDT